MRLNRRVFVGAALAAASPIAAHANGRNDLPLDEILARHTAARGGAAAIDAIHSQSSDVQIVEGGSVITGHYVCSKAPEFRIDIFDHGKHVFCEGLDAQGPWIWPSSEPAPKPDIPDARRTAIQGIEFNLYGLHAFRALGNSMELAGREMLGGIDHYVIRVNLKDSYPTFLYIDPETWMIVRRRDFRAAHPAVDDTKKHLEKQYSDFRPVNGVQTAFLEHQVALATGKITQVSIVDRMEYNPTLGPQTFYRLRKE